MKISTILDHIDNGHMALPEFQRGYVWYRDQVRGLFESLYRRHPVGGLLVWATESETAEHRGDGPLATGIVKLLLDGQQRMTSLYGVIRGKPPRFFDGNSQAFTGLQFHLGTETFAFYQPIKMKDDPLWVDVSDLMKKGNAGLGEIITKISALPNLGADVGTFIGRLSNLLAIAEIDLHIEEVTGADKTIDVVVDIFNRVNSGGTKLSKGDLALAKICADWPDARDKMKIKIREWEEAGNYGFTLDWLLRSVNTAVTGEAKFSFLDGKNANDIKDGLRRASKHIETCLNMIGGRLGLDHGQVFFARFGIPVMVRYLDKIGRPLNEIERDKLLFWYAQSGMWGRFSNSTESTIDQDLGALEIDGGGIEKLIEQLRLWQGGLRAEAAHFSGSSLGSRFYPVLYMITRMGQARDWGTGLPLKSNLLGRLNKLEVHHIFPKAQLYKRSLSKSEVNALGNFCFLTKDTNLKILDRLPEQYFPEIEAAHPGALESQWIPQDEKLWKMENYLDFLEARKALLADEVNRRMLDLLHGDEKWMETRVANPIQPIEIVGGIVNEEEEKEIEDFNNWMVSKNLPKGIVSYDFADSETGEQRAVLDLAWPNGIQEELSNPVALLLNETSDVLAVASQAGFKCFLTTYELRKYIQSDILSDG